MRKSIFRSLSRDENGYISAIKREGFTDGTFNYYSVKPAGKNYLIWCAIDPITGLSVYSDRGKKKVIDYVYSDEFIKKFEDFKTTEKYKEYVNSWYKYQVECGAIMEIKNEKDF